MRPPSFEVVDRINVRFQSYGSGGGWEAQALGFPDRLHRSCPEHLRGLLAHPGAYLVALVFSLRRFSGFDSLEEALGEHRSAIDGVETGLSSDPAMNRRISALDQIPLISNLDAHSLPKLGREATVLEAPADLDAIRSAIRSHDPTRFLYTIEFYPEEGKYHYDGHRGCKVSLPPEETETYERLIALGGTELRILIDLPPEALATFVPPLILEGILRMRSGKVTKMPGYDGIYGRISVLK